MSGGFDQHRKQLELERLEQAAARASDRDAAPRTADEVVDVSAAGRVGEVLLHLAGGGVLATVGVGVFFWGLPVIGALGAGLGLGIMIRGLVRGASGGPGGGPGGVSEVDPRIRAAYERACDAINSSVRIDAQRSMELVGRLRAGYDEICRLESQRSQVVDGLNALPADGGGAAGDALREAADRLDAQRRSFIDQCAQLQASVAMLGLKPGDNQTALDGLVQATSSFSEEAAAVSELEDAIAQARSVRKTPAG